MENTNPYMIDVDMKLGRLKRVLEEYGYYYYIGEGFNKFIYINQRGYELYIGYIPGIGYKSYVMNGKRVINDIEPVKNIDQVLNLVNIFEQLSQDWYTNNRSY